MILTSNTKICHDMNDGQHCFLSQPEWRQIFSDKPTSSTGRASTSLRSAICNFLVDLPGIIFQGTRLQEKESKDSEFLLGFLRRAIAMHNAIEVCYHENLLPLLSSDSSIPKDSVNRSQSSNAQYNSEHRYEDILLAVLDCILNSVLSRLHQLIACLMSDLPGSCLSGLDIPTSRLSRADRLVISQSALTYVRNHSLLASKPLEFSLSLIKGGKFLSRRPGRTELY